MIWAIHSLGCNGSHYYQTPYIDNLASGRHAFYKCLRSLFSFVSNQGKHNDGQIPGTTAYIQILLQETIGMIIPFLSPTGRSFYPSKRLPSRKCLKKRGYSTALFGKWHLSPEKTPPESLPYNPDKQGFDEIFVTYKPSGDLIQPWQEAENDAHNVDTITSLAVDFLERNKSKSFFLYVSHNTIHNPLKERDASIQKFRSLNGSEEPENNPVIGAMIERLDNSCGRIFNKISELGLEENTVVIFFSDNGGLKSDASQSPFREGKGWLYEGGIREPLIVKWKNVVTPGTISGSLISSIDFFPTFLEFAGIETLPENVDGKSFIPVLKDPEAEIHSSLFWHFPHYHNGPPAAAVRSGKMETD